MTAEAEVQDVDLGGMRRCNTCLEFKPLSEFHRDRTKTDPYRRICKVCVAAQSRAYYAAHPEQATSRKPGRFAIYRAVAIAAYGGECVDCGSTEGLEFDPLPESIAQTGISPDLELRCHSCRIDQSDVERMAAEGTKRCSCCRVEKPVADFYRDRAQADGLEWTCKACRKEQVARRRQGQGAARFEHGETPEVAR